jgi:alkylated DNA nucleotide flippase Atl1
MTDYRKFRITAIHAVWSILNNGNLTTAHQIARITGYSPQHVNRVLKQLFQQGKVAYTIMPHRGNAKQKRKWCTMGNLHCWENVYPFETPVYVQEELL